MTSSIVAIFAILVIARDRVECELDQSACFESSLTDPDGIRRCDL
jgi:hypothetical protein